MSSHKEYSNIRLTVVIVRFGQGSEVLRKAHQCGIRGGTVLLGRGTVHSRILELFAIADVRRELVLLISDRQTSSRMIGELDSEFRFERPNQGIVFSVPLSAVMSCIQAGQTAGRDHQRTEETHTMVQAIVAIVAKGKGEDVVEAAGGAGAAGGTILNARGSGSHEISKVFSMEIESEREVVLLLVPAEKTEGIVAAVEKKLEMDRPGNGVLLVQDVPEVYGLRE